MTVLCRVNEENMTSNMKEARYLILPMYAVVILIKRLIIECFYIEYFYNFNLSD